MKEPSSDPGYNSLVAFAVVMVLVTLGLTYQRCSAPKMEAAAAKNPSHSLPPRPEIKPVKKPRARSEIHAYGLKTWRNDGRPIPSQHAINFVRELIVYETTPDDIGLTATETHMLMNAKKKLLSGEGRFSRY